MSDNKSGSNGLLNARSDRCGVVYKHEAISEEACTHTASDSDSVRICEVTKALTPRTSISELAKVHPSGSVHAAEPICRIDKFCI